MFFTSPHGAKGQDNTYKLPSPMRHSGFTGTNIAVGTNHSTKFI